jgi:methylthioribose-1-phosphate isomerase
LSEYYNLRIEADELSFINQVLLPGTITYVKTDSYERISEAIERLEIRGAPAIGIAVAYALALSQKKEVTQISFNTAYSRLERTRPTAVNLFWALQRMRTLFTKKYPDITYADLLAEAIAIHDEDIRYCDLMGEHGLQIFRKPSNVITHCNTGKLAVGGAGTAFSVIRTAFQHNLVKHVYADETRPLLQGARLTAFELGMQGIPYSLISDSTAGFLMKQGKVDLAITGADRITVNGDAANKIGTYSLAALCKFHGIPFYIAAPSSTIDKTLKSGDEIPIEIRSAEELLSIGGKRIAPDGANAYTPAFDVVPAELISGIITESGLYHRPYNMSAILTTEAIVLSSVDYSDSSKIVSLLTKESGKISVIAKGARQKKSKLGLVLNPLNIIQAVIYMKPNRDIQVMSSADLVTHFQHIETDYDSIKFAWAVLELVNICLLEHEHEERIFRAVQRILTRMNNATEPPFLSFLRFFLFLFGELGFEVNMDECTQCRKPLSDEDAIFTSLNGMTCGPCAQTIHEKTYLNKELFFLLKCLKNGKEIENPEEADLRTIYRIFENYASHHVSSFRPLKSLRI